MTVIEFPLNPHITRSYGYIAHALGYGFYLLPQLSTSYDKMYTLTPSSTQAALRLITHAIKERGLHHLIKKNNKKEDL